MKLHAILIFLIATIVAGNAAELSGRATVIDGDDIELWADGGPPKRIRLCGIDVPNANAPVTARQPRSCVLLSKASKYGAYRWVKAPLATEGRGPQTETVLSLSVS
jgi:endonuclease YncB( thermonuclease family)